MYFEFRFLKTLNRGKGIRLITLLCFFLISLVFQRIKLWKKYVYLIWIILYLTLKYFITAPSLPLKRERLGEKVDCTRDSRGMPFFWKSLATKEQYVEFLGDWFVRFQTIDGNCCTKKEWAEGGYWVRNQFPPPPVNPGRFLAHQTQPFRFRAEMLTGFS